MSMDMRRSMSLRASEKGKKVASDEDERIIPLGLYMTYIKTELAAESACLELPFTFVLLFSFSALAYLHLRQFDVYVLENAMRFDIEQNANFAWNGNFGHKTIYDVNSIGDFWSWFRLGFLPLMVQHSWGFSESLQAGYDAVNVSSPFNSAGLPGNLEMSEYGENPLPVRNDYLHHNRIIGGFRMRQERSQIGWDLCRIPAKIPEDLWKRWLGKPCVPASPAYELMPEIGAAESFGEPRRVEWLFSAINTLKHMQRKTIDMEDGCADMAMKVALDPNATDVGGTGICLCATCGEGSSIVGPWFDEQTQRIEISWVNFNFQYGLYSMVNVNFMINRGGHIHKIIDIRSAWAHTFPGDFWQVAGTICCDLIWLLSLTYILLIEVREIVKVIRSSKEQWWVALWQEYIGFWNIVDWISVFVAYAVFACWYQTFSATKAVNEDFEALAKMNPSAVTRDTYMRAVEDFMSLSGDLYATEGIFRMSFMVYPMVVMLRLFKSFDAQPRLAVVTRTLVRSTQDMIHFFIIFFSCYFCLTVNAVLLFGQDIEDFATLDRALMTCFRGLFGKWDYGQMQEVGLLQCAVWFWAFLLILNLIMLNILLAILLDAYAMVQSTAANKTTLPTQISEIVRRYRQTQAKERAKLSDIYASYLKDIGDERDMLTHEPAPGFPPGTGGRQNISPEDIIQHVYTYMRIKVPLKQAERGIKFARRMHRIKFLSPYTVVDVHKGFKLLESLTREVRSHLRKAAGIMRTYDFDEADEEFIQKVPENPEDDCTEQKTLVADAVKGVVYSLSDEIGSTLTRETELFARRQKALEQAQGEMLVTARDAAATLDQLRGRTDEVVRQLQQMAQQRQRMAAGRAANAASIAASVLASLGSGPCSEAPVRAGSAPGQAGSKST